MPRAKSQKTPSYPKTVFVQHMADGDDNYLLVYEHLDDIDLDIGHAVAIYTLGRPVNVVPGGRTIQEVN